MDYEIFDHKQIRIARKNLGLTQEQAAELVNASRRTWQSWEKGINGINPAIWELFLLKTDQHPTHHLVVLEAGEPEVSDSQATPTDGEAPV